MTSEQKALANLLDAVEGVLQYTWDDNDEDAAEAINRLRAANEELGVVQRLAQQPATPSSKDVLTRIAEALQRNDGAFKLTSLLMDAGDEIKRLRLCLHAEEAMRADEEAPAPASEEQLEWRCFHCDEVFTDREAAADHFGVQIDGTADDVACKLNATDGLLLRMLREAQEELRQYRQEDNASFREFYSLGAAHAIALRSEEEKGYARGLDDARKHPETLGLRTELSGSHPDDLVTRRSGSSENTKTAAQLPVETTESIRECAIRDLSYRDGAQQALVIAHQSLEVADVWFRDLWERSKEARAALKTTETTRDVLAEAIAKHGGDPVYCTTCGQEDRDCYCMPEMNAGKTTARRSPILEALKPFAELGGPQDGFPAFHDLEEDVVIYSNSGAEITAGDVRRARDAIHMDARNALKATVICARCEQPGHTRQECTK